MISIDSNVLLRYVLQDDQLQARRAERLIRANEMVLVTDVVLVETIWTLTGAQYLVGREAIASTLHDLFNDGSICFEDETTVWRALQTYSTAKPVKVPGKNRRLDFADALAFHKSAAHARRNDTHLDAFYSFDKAAQQLPGCRAP